MEEKSMIPLEHLLFILKNSLIIVWHNGHLQTQGTGFNEVIQPCRWSKYKEIRDVTDWGAMR